MDINTLLESLQTPTEVFTATDILLTIILSFVLAMVIGFIYRDTYRGNGIYSIICSHADFDEHGCRDDHAHH